MKKVVMMVGLIFIFVMASCGTKPSPVSKDELNSKVRSTGEEIGNQVQTNNEVVMDPTDSNFKGITLGDIGLRLLANPAEIGVILDTESFFSPSGSFFSPPAVFNSIKSTLKIKPLQEEGDDEFRQFLIALPTLCESVSVDTNPECDVSRWENCTYMKATMDGSCTIRGVEISGSGYVEFQAYSDTSGYVNINIDVDVKEPQSETAHIILQVYINGTYDPLNGKIEGESAFYFLNDSSNEYTEGASALTIKASGGGFNISLEGGYVECPANWDKTSVLTCYKAEYGKIDNLTVSGVNECGGTIDGSGEYASWDGDVASYVSADFDKVVVDKCYCLPTTTIFQDDIEPKDGIITLSNGLDTLKLDYTDRECTDGCPKAIIYNNEDITSLVCY